MLVDNIWEEAEELTKVLYSGPELHRLNNTELWDRTKKFNPDSSRRLPFALTDAGKDPVQRVHILTHTHARTRTSTNTPIPTKQLPLRVL